MEYDNISEIFNYEMFNDTSVAVGCHHFGSRLPSLWQSGYSRAAVSAKPFVWAHEPECGRIWAPSLHPS